MHSMLRDGVPHRFCQQCGRFQPLTEFDEDRRTCRRKVGMRDNLCTGFMCSVMRSAKPPHTG
mgnify:CR=1 FL=1